MRMASARSRLATGPVGARLPRPGSPSRPADGPRRAKGRPSRRWSPSRPADGPDPSHNRIHGLVSVGFGLGAADPPSPRDFRPQTERGSDEMTRLVGYRRSGLVLISPGTRFWETSDGRRRTRDSCRRRQHRVQELRLEAQTRSWRVLSRRLRPPIANG